MSTLFFQTGQHTVPNITLTTVKPLEICVSVAFRCYLKLKTGAQTTPPGGTFLNGSSEVTDHSQTLSLKVEKFDSVSLIIITGLVKIIRVSHS